MTSKKSQQIEMPMVSVFPFVALCLALFGYLGDARAGAVVLNSNAIKTLPGAGTLPILSSPADAVSPSPHTLTFESGGQNLVIDTLQVMNCVDDDDCGSDEFCNDARSACLPCRKRRKRCTKDAMCCAGNRCSNGVCLPGDVDGNPHMSTKDGLGALHGMNHTVDLQAKRVPPAPPQLFVKGREGDSCLRSSDCADGLCCARHFWSRICKPVLSEGQVCTRHRRKGAHGLELFQRCDCGDGLACRAQRGDAGVSRSVRNLHTCQRR